MRNVFGRRWACGIGIAALAAVCATSTAWAQLGPARTAGGAAPAAAAADDSPAGRAKQEFVAIRAQLQALHQRGEAIMAEYRDSKDLKQKTAMEQEFDKLENARADLVPKLLKSAEVAYVADPQGNKEAGQMLLQASTEHLQFGDFLECRRLCMILQQRQFPEPQITALAGLASLYLDDLAAADQMFTAAEQQKTLPEELAPYVRECRTRVAEAKADDLPRVVLKTTKGDVVVELYENEAPNTVANFVGLVEKGFYKNLAFHRVLEDFMAQGGDPKGDGSGGPGYNIACECQQPNHRVHLRGTLSMAHAGKDTGGSQFFIAYRPTPHLDGVHTVFGRVIQGMEVVDKFQRVDPSQPKKSAGPADRILEATVIRKRNHPYSPKITAVQNVPMRR